MVRRSSAVAALACMCVLGLSSVANAQGSRKDDIVFNAQGRPMAGATVRICTSSATGQPCSPLANIYSDSGLTQALANPISTDGLGNYSFYAAPGRYTVEISGPNIATKQIPDVILPNDPSAPTFSSVTSTSGISAFSLSLSGNLTVTGSAAVTGALTAAGSPVATTALPNTWTAAQTFSTPVTLSSAGLQGGNVAAKADNTQNVRYVIGNGNDANDGLSMGSGKLSLYGALVDLIDNAGTLNTSGGAIHYASSRADYGPTLSAPFGTVAPGIYSGIWIMGSNDPNYVTASTLTRSGGTLTITTNATVPSSPYYTPGMTITLFAAGDPSYDGNCTIASAGGTTITCPQSGSDGSLTGASVVIVPIGWIPQTGSGFDFRCEGGDNGTGPGGSAPNCLVEGGVQLNPVNITSISESGSTVTAVMSGGTWFKGAPVFVNGVSTAGYNGYWIISSVTGGTTITYTAQTTGLAPDSTGQAQIEYPSIWLSSVSGLTFRDSTFSGPLPLLIGVDSNMTLNPATPEAEIHFINDTFNVSTGAGNTLSGPATWIGSNFLWGYFDNCMWQSNPYAPVGSDQRSAFLMKSTGAATSGLIKIWHGNSSGGGGIRWYQQSGSGSFTVDGFLEEGSGQSQPVVEVMSGSGSLAAELHDLGISDSGDHPPIVRVPQNWSYGGSNTSIVWYANGLGNGYVQGPVTVVNVGSSVREANGAWSFTGPRVSGQGQGQFGFSAGKAVNLETNAGRSNGAPSVVRFANLASSNPANWTVGEGTGVTIAAGQPDRLGGTGAAQLTCTAVGADNYCSAIAYSGSPTINVGDYLVASVWAKPADHSAGFAASNGSAIILTGMPSVGVTYRSGGTTNSPGSTQVLNPPPYNDGGWQHIFLWSKATSAQTSTMNMRLAWTPGNPVVLFDPQFYVISASQVAVPAAPSVSQSGGGTLAATTYYVRVTYTSALGETTSSPFTTFAASANNVITVTSPAASTGATNWNVYVGNSASCPDGTNSQWNDMNPGEWCLIRQNSSPIAIGTNWTEPTSGILTFSNWYDGAATGAGRTQPTNDTTNVYGDSEIADWALNLGDFSSTCSVNQLCSANGPITGGAFSTQASAYTLKVTDSWVNVTGNNTVTVPHAIVGQRWVVFNSGSGTVTIQPDSGNINGGANITLSANSGKEIVCDGTNCFAH